MRAQLQERLRGLLRGPLQRLFPDIFPYIFPYTFRKSFRHTFREHFRLHTYIHVQTCSWFRQNRYATNIDHDKYCPMSSIVRSILAPRSQVRFDEFNHGIYSFHAVKSGSMSSVTISTRFTQSSPVAKIDRTKMQRFPKPDLSELTLLVK
jgi:hypothetical protein